MNKEAENKEVKKEAEHKLVTKEELMEMTNDEFAESLKVFCELRVDSRGRHNISCPRGWRHIVYDALGIYAGTGAYPRVGQVKEKFETLRIYLDSTDDLWRSIEAKASRQAQETCGFCGGVCEAVTETEVNHRGETVTWDHFEFYCSKHRREDDISKSY